ncbi:ABC transporter permease [Pedobacter sp. MC2016-15]|uniref:ABC transporter permease n=1 Tax=Pedobacter sp. MC2016-15 TaxID=2994473 RepID=UPI002246EDA5|nr:ABC transporter permease [Pedobacter sp. MC2016-15]MCX2479546.1 ABC transporter permease [Pedobacter sp. MC2016-15]
MFKLNFIIALRNLWKNKTASLINISGLAIGLASCLLLLLYVSYEWNFDKQAKDAKDIYRVLVKFDGTNGEIRGVGYSTPNTIGPALKETYSSVKAMSRLDDEQPRLIANGRKSFKKTGRFADADILKIFDYHFIAGDQKTALDAPNNVILTASMAKMLFGTTDVLNKSVRFEDKVNLKITGVIEDLPENTSIKLDYLMPWTLFEGMYEWVKRPMWTNNNWSTFVKMAPSSDIESLNHRIKGIIKEHVSDATSSPFLYQFSKLHLYGKFTGGENTGGRIEQLRLFMGLAIGILLIACINFMNMATAKSEKRAKEVGIKKTIGATRGSLISQFLIESLVLTLGSAVMAIVLVEVFLPLFNNLLGIKMGINYANPYLWISLIAIVISTGIIAGSYPAFYLSSFNPLQVLKKRNPGRKFWSVSLRQVLVVVQFSFAVILIISTAVIYKQIQYLKDRPVGYEVNDLVELAQDGQLEGKFELLKQRLLQSGAVSSICQLSGTMSNNNSNFWGLEWPGSTETDRHMVFNQLSTTYDFAKTTGIKVVEGRDFSRQFPSDTAAVMLSQSAVKVMNLVHPIGTIVKYQGNDCTVVGVFEDFIWGAPFEKEEPLIVAFNKYWSGYVTMRPNPAHPMSENLAVMEKIIKDINPAYPVEFKFIDQLYGEKIKSQKILGLLSNVFGGLAIFISCLGLFGLAAYSAEQRTKEIGVRKVLGASLSSLMQLLSLNFLKMVALAIIIAIPVANYVMNNWLKTFVFHTTISWVMIILAALATIAIAMITVSYQAYKAAKANPVDALKYE